MKLFYSNGACSLASRIAINELGLDCKYETVDFKTNQTAGGIDFSTINPKGSVPTLRLPNGEILTEGAIILQYLADNNPQGENFIPKEMSMPRYRVLERINFIASDFHKSVGALFNPDLPKEVKDSALKPRLDKLINYVEKELSHTTFFAGNTYTFADTYLFVISSWFDYLEIDRKSWPKLNKYYENLKTRPAIVKSLEEEK
jgi:glutathione S-transferase